MDKSKLAQDPATEAILKVYGEEEFIDKETSKVYKCEEFKIADPSQKERYEYIMNHQDEKKGFVILDKKIFTSTLGGVTIFLEYYEVKPKDEKVNDSKQKSNEVKTEIVENTSTDITENIDVVEDDDIVEDTVKYKMFAEEIDPIDPPEAEILVEEENFEENIKEEE